MNKKHWKKTKAHSWFRTCFNNFCRNCSAFELRFLRFCASIIRLPCFFFARQKKSSYIRRKIAHCVMKKFLNFFSLNTRRVEKPTKKATTEKKHNRIKGNGTILRWYLVCCELRTNSIQCEWLWIMAIFAFYTCAISITMKVAETKTPTDRTTKPNTNIFLACSSTFGLLFAPKDPSLRLRIGQELNIE